MRELRQILAAFARLKRPAALATIIGTQGSSYRRAGARLLVHPDGSWIGTLSGGCIEEDVAAQALRVLETGRPQVIAVDTLQRYGCPGSLEILLERIDLGNACLSYLEGCFAARVPAEIVVLRPAANDAPAGSHPRANFPAAEGFSQTLLPPIRLVILGGGADTLALREMAGVLGWDAVVLEQAGELSALADQRSALVVKNHHFGRDAAALAAGFARPFGYVGLLSSRPRKRQLLKMLETELPDRAIPPAQFYGPAGLDLGAESPEEVALSIIAEIQAAMTSHEAGFLRDRRTPIHQSRCVAAAF